MMTCFGCEKPEVEVKGEHDGKMWCDRCLRAAVLPEIETLWMDTKRKPLTTYKATLRKTLDIARQLYASAVVQMVVQRGAMYPWEPSQVRLTVGREL